MNCTVCDKPLDGRTTTGLCRKHSAKRLIALMPAERLALGRERAGEAMRKYWMAHPEKLAAAAERLRQMTQTPEHSQRASETMKRNRTWEIGWQTCQTPEARARRRQSMSDRKLSWCPPELRDEYRRLRRKKNLPASEAREIVLAQHERDMARFRERFAA